MKKNLTKNTNELYYYENGVKKIVDYNNKKTYPKNISGEINSELRGDISELRGDISGLWGNVSELRGDISGLWGDISQLWGDISGLRGEIDSGLRGNISGLWGEINSGLWGNISGIKGLATGIRGDLDSCEITEEERKKGIDIQDLVKPKQ